MENKIENEKVEMPSLNAPDPDLNDRIHSVVSGTLGSVPLAGAVLQEAFNALVSPSLEKRREKWIESIVTGLYKLDEKGSINLDELQNDEQFITAMMGATNVAMRTHRKEKLAALTGVVLNTAINKVPKDEVQQLFLNLVDRFSVLHLLVIRALEDRKSYRCAITSGGKDRIPIRISRVSPEFEVMLSGLEYRQVHYHAWIDLDSAGVVSLEHKIANHTSGDSLVITITEFGLEFLSYVKSPIKD